MLFDPNNKIVQCCVQGMNAESTGDITGARQLFEKAWNEATNDTEWFIAAHYLARNQTDAQVALKWNLEALNHALKVDDTELKGHYPSLYLNTGKSYETMGEVKEATAYYQLAARACQDLPEGQYAGMIRSGVREGLKRVNVLVASHPQLEALVNGWCEKKELKPLSMVLPVYLADLGTDPDKQKLINVLSMVSATRCLSPADQKTVETIVRELR